MTLEARVAELCAAELRRSRDLIAKRYGYASRGQPVHGIDAMLAKLRGRAAARILEHVGGPDKVRQEAFVAFLEQAGYADPSGDGARRQAERQALREAVPA